MLRMAAVSVRRLAGNGTWRFALRSLAVLAGLVAFSATSVLPALAVNEIVPENLLPGNPQSEWDISGAGDPSIQGFATDISVNTGETIAFKVGTASPAYRIDIYRLGYYNGAGGRRIATVKPSVPLPQPQPPCLTDMSVRLYDCGRAAGAHRRTGVGGPILITRDDLVDAADLHQRVRRLRL